MPTMPTIRDLPVVPVTIGSERADGTGRRAHHRLRRMRPPAHAMCDDCVVTFLVDRQPEDAVVVDADEARAVRLLERAGLVPGVRHVRQVS